MDRTIRDLKIGTRLKFGAYGCRGNAPVPIVWLKASPDCDFIAECALDSIQFDNQELEQGNRDRRWNGNNEYGVSNIYQFLNSDEQVWYQQTHQYDRPPNYQQYPGFLTGFADFEKASLMDGVNLPAFGDIIGGNTFALFRKKGVRPHPSADMQMRFWNEYMLTSYIPFWTRDPMGGSETRVMIIGRDGYGASKEASGRAGLRPVCNINGRAVVEIDDDGIYKLKAFEVADVVEEIYTDDALFNFLGLR